MNCSECGSQMSRVWWSKYKTWVWGCLPCRNFVEPLVSEDQLDLTHEKGWR